MYEEEYLIRKRLEIATLELDCKIGKDKHFNAAQRKDFLRKCFGLYAVIGSAIISSNIGKDLSPFLHQCPINFSDDLTKVFASILSTSVGIATAIISFLGWEKQTTQHKLVGNSYIEIARRARAILNSINEKNFNEKEIEYQDLLKRYSHINKESESCPTNNHDITEANINNRERRKKIKEKEKEVDEKILAIKQYSSF